ncbi:MAG TPA: adenosylcobinamide-GDP ribazoletransferase [Candidatus Angelobacter sp.]|nr:adenosylcobinamide-GDP ribazoletransferase [Candidatus Angelobacter sp.]
MTVSVPATAPPRRGVAWRALGALGFLTVLPLPARAHGMPTGVTLACFGPAGLLLGGVMAALEIALAPVLPLAARSAVLLAVLAAACGAMHLDGLMDSADGLFGARTRERRLEIMRDSRVGGYGTAAAVLVVLIQYAALSSVVERRPLAVLAAVGLSRGAAALALGLARPARDEGLASVYSVSGRTLAGVVAFAATAAVAIPLCGWRGAAACGAALLVVAAVIAVFTRRVGGMTGDGFGAVVELTLAGALLCLAAQR